MERCRSFDLEETGQMNWEECYQRGETPWDKAAPAPELARIFQQGCLKGNVLVPGCGRGHDVRAIANAGASWVLGIDLAPSAVRDAQELGIPEGAEFAQGDLFELLPEWTQRFDWVWEHTCFCAIPPACRPDYVKGVLQALKPGGHLLAIFFLDPGLDDPNDGPPFGVSREDLDNYFSGLFALEDEWQPRATYPGREGRELVRLLRRL